MSYYCYAWLREDGSPYYIGKGKGRRAYVKHQSIYPPEKDRIVIIKDGMMEQDAYRLETALIEFYGRKDLGTGILRNMSVGGRGNSGGFNEQTINKLSQMAKERLKENPEFGFTSDQSIEVQKRKLQEGSHTFSDLNNQSQFGKRSVEALKARGNYGPAQEWTCENCGKHGKNKTNYIRFHGSNCKRKVQ